MGVRGENRRKRAGLWIAGLAIIAAIGATYRPTRPPELVWWTTPVIADTRRHVRVLIPRGWTMEDRTADTIIPKELWHRYYQIRPTDDRPHYLRRILPEPIEEAIIGVGVEDFGRSTNELNDSKTTVPRLETQDGLHIASRTLICDGGRIWADVTYTRADIQAFTATYDAICNSLRIE
jgi:hypothetical protein